MTSDALILAALATAAVPGLRPIRAEAVRGRVGERYQVGFVEDAEHRRWVVRVPGDAVAAAQQDASVTLLGMLARRLPFALPAPKGFAALKDGRRAMVYPLITGHALSFFAMPPGPGPAAELGRALAALHNVDRRLFEEAAVPTYDAEHCRHRQLVLLDRGAATGAVPVGLLSRWERLLDDVSWWRFAPTPVHGRLDGPHVLASFDSPEDASSGRVRAIVGWEDAHVGDPAEDLAALVAQASSETVDTVVEAYAMSRHEHPDSHLEERARLVAELRLVEDLLAATAAKHPATLAAAVEALQHLDAKVGEGASASGGLSVERAGAGEGRVYSAGEPDAGVTSQWVRVAADVTPPEPADSAAVYSAGSRSALDGVGWSTGRAAPPTAAPETADDDPERATPDGEGAAGTPAAGAPADGAALADTPRDSAYTTVEIDVSSGAGRPDDGRPSQDGSIEVADDPNGDARGAEEPDAPADGVGKDSGVEDRGTRDATSPSTAAESMAAPDAGRTPDADR